MSETTASLRRKIAGAGDLQSVVRTMKAMAASSIGQYEKSVLALADYYRTVELGLCACFRQSENMPLIARRKERAAEAPIIAVVFGSDQGLVGQFNDLVADFAVETLAPLQKKPLIWAVGGRVGVHLEDAGQELMGQFNVPNSVRGITPLIGQILQKCVILTGDEAAGLYIFYNHHISSSVYEPTSQRLMPLDETWQRNLAEIAWPTGKLPEVMGSSITTLRALVREYLFVSLFRACVESLASENASRLAAMERADKNIDELLEDLTSAFHRLRQGRIDEELFDVISGFEALNEEEL